MTDVECRKHHFGSDGRCSYCQMKETYYNDAMHILNSTWTQQEKDNPSEHWKDKVDSYQCKPHKHLRCLGCGEIHTS